MARQALLTKHRPILILLEIIILVSLTSLKSPEVEQLAESRRSVYLQTMQAYQLFLPIMSNDLPTPPFGVQIYFTFDDDHPALQAMVGLPTAWIRIPVSWANIEPTDTTPENYQWDAYDNTFRSASSHGLDVIATLGHNPTWAAESVGGPPDMNAYLEFLAALVERYDGDGNDDAPGSPIVKAWEFYNEPDNTFLPANDPGYGYWGYLGAEYADFMSQVYPVVKAAAPDALVLMGGVAYDNFVDQGGAFDRAFVDDFLAAGGGSYTDYFNFHYYPYLAANWAAYGPDVIGKINFLQTKLAAYGLADKPLAITEIGLSSGANFGGTEELQSRYVVQAYSRALTADVEIIIWFALNDLPPRFIFGLTRSDFTPKPSYAAYHTLTVQLASATYQRTLSSTELGSDQAEGYLYSRGAETVYVVWTNDDSAAQLELQAGSVTRIEKEGSSTIISDADDGLVDGRVTIQYGGSPIYLIPAP